MTTYLLQDLFTTTQGAPLTTPRTCEPTGSLNLVDTATGTAESISGGKLLQPRPTGNQSYANFGFQDVTSRARANGLMAHCVFQTSRGDRVAPMGWSLASGQAEPIYAIRWTDSFLQLSESGAAVAIAPSLNVDYQFAIILRGNGALHLIKGGSQYSSWTLLYVTAFRIDPLTWLTGANFNADGKWDSVAALQKSGLLAKEFGKALVFSPLVASGDVAVGAGDSLDYVAWTPRTGETLSFEFRRSDVDNLYRVDCDQAGGTIKLYRRQAAVETELDAGKLQTWTVGTGYRIGIVHAAGEIRTLVESISVDAAAKNAVTGEAFNLTATGVKLYGSSGLANLEIWPRTFSGTDETDIA